MTLKNYNTLFIIFLVISIILFILLVILFFAFDIRKIIRIKTGWGIKQSVKELNEINQEEGNRQRKKYKAHSIQLFKNQSDNLLEQNSNIKNYNKETDIKNFTASSPDATVTVKLKQEDNQTMVLQTNLKSHLSQNIPDSGEDVKEEIFNIFEKKTVIFSNEIITRQGILTEI